MISLCPCKSSLVFNECCKPIINNEKLPQSAEELMRSRYSAYATKNIEYLVNSSCEIINNIKERIDIEAFCDAAYFQHLEIVSVKEYVVEFKAYYIVGKKQEVLHEKSNFIHKSDGSWCYRDGEIYKANFTYGRNSSCICGSSKKYKQCCEKRIL